MKGQKCSILLKEERNQISNGFARLLLMAAAVIALPGFAKAGFFVFRATRVSISCSASMTPGSSR
jgi:hypothetical protein